MLTTQERFILLTTLVLIILPISRADCTRPISVLPPELAYKGILIMDGYEWKVEETITEATITRTMSRVRFDYPERDAYITQQQAEQIARQFFERNERVLGVPQSIEVAAIEEVLPVEVKFTSTEKQYCENMEVIGTVSGTMNIGGGDEYEVSSLTITWYSKVNLKSLTPEISLEEILDKNPGTKPELAILPTGNDEFKLVWKIDEDKFIDANSGKETSEEKEHKKKALYKTLFLTLPCLAVVILGYFIIRRSGKINKHQQPIKKRTKRG